MQEARAGHGASARAVSCPCSPAPPRLAAPFPPPLRAWRRAATAAPGEAPPSLLLLRKLRPPAARGRRARDPAPAPGGGPPAGGGDEIGGYTPADYITYSDDPRHALAHAVEVAVDAPLGVCVALWSEWAGLVEFLDLIGKVGLDPDLPDMALLFCYYRWAKLPVMEISCLLRRDLAAPPTARLGPASRRIAFESEHGMPLRGDVEFVEAPDGRTRVALRAEHPLPSLLALLGVAPSAVEAHVASVLGQNLARFAALARARAPEGSWDREAAARRGKAAAAAAAAQQQQQQQQQAAEEAAAAAAAAGGARGAGGAAAAAAAAAGAPAAAATAGATEVPGAKEQRRRSRSSSASRGGSGDSGAAGEAAAAAPESNNGKATAARRRSISRPPTETLGESAAGGGAAAAPPGRRRTSTTGSSSAMARR